MSEWEEEAAVEKVKGRLRLNMKGLTEEKVEGLDKSLMRMRADGKGYAY